MVSSSPVSPTRTALIPGLPQATVRALLGIMRLGVIVIALAGVYRAPFRDPWPVVLPWAAFLSTAATVLLWAYEQRRRRRGQRPHVLSTYAAVGLASVDWLWVALVALPELGLGPATGALVVVLIALHGVALPPGAALIADLGGIVLYATLGAGGWLLIAPQTLWLQVAVYGCVAVVVTQVSRSIRAESARYDDLASRFAAFASAQTALLDTLPVGVLVLDRHLTPAYANRMAFALLGIERPRRVDEFTRAMRNAHGPLGDRLQQLVLDVLGDGQARRERFEIAEPVAVEGEASASVPGRPVRLDATVLPTPSGALVGVVVADARDEAILRHYVRLAERGAAVRELAGALAHEIRNPLMAITTAAQVIERVEPRQQAPAVALVRQERDRVRRLLDEFLQFRRVPTHVQYAGIEVRPFAHRLAQSEALLANERGITFTAQVAPDLTSVMGDEEQLTRALTNLFANARRYVPAGGHIIFDVHRTTAEEWRRGSGTTRPATDEPLDDSVTWCVRDTGPGVSSHVLAHIGEAFVRGGDGGTGLGLAIVRRVAAVHGGVLRIRNRPEGGAEVLLITPRRVARPALP